jgi:putative ABC transport system permease protein
VSLLDTKRRRDIRRQRGQFLAVSVTIALGVMLFASTYDAYRNLDGSYNATYDRLAFADINVIGVAAEFAATAEDIDGVDEAEARLEADLPMRVDGDTFLGRVVAYPPDRQPLVDEIDVVEGSYLDPDDTSAVVIETHMADQFDLGVGDTVEVLAGGSWLEGHVVGIAISAEYIWPARDNQDIFPLPGTFGVAFVSSDLTGILPSEAVRDDVIITYDDKADADVVAEIDSRVRAAAETAGASDVITRADHPSNSTLLLDVNGFASMSILFPVLFMSAAGMAAFVLLTRLVFAQRGTIGTLRASGMRRQLILRHYLSYGIRLGLVAGVVGLLLGMASAYAITGVYTAQLDIPDTVRSFHWTTPVIGMLFAVVAGALGAWAPARRAFKVSPAEAMRGATPDEPGKPSWLEKVIPPLRRLPVRWLMILRGLGRNKRRSLATILGVVLGLILIMVSWGMIDSILVMLDKQFEEVSLQDADVALAAPVTDEAIRPVSDVEGVEEVEIVSRLDATARFEGESFATSLVGYDQGTVMHGFPGGVPASGLLAGSGLTDHLDVEVGDELVVSLPTLGTDFTETLVGLLDEPVGIVLYIDREGMADIVGDDTLVAPTVSQLQVEFDDGVGARETMIDDIGSLEEVAFVADSRALYELLQSFLGFFYAFVGFMLALGGAMAFALMYNAISVNVAERTPEFASMRANGLSHDSIARLIAFENILLTVIGVIPGAALGYVVGIYFMRQFSVDAFTLDFAMRPSSIAISMVAMIVAAALSLIPAIRRVRRIDIGETVRERAV